MIIKISKDSFIERLVYMLFWLLPFSFLIDKTIFNGTNVFGISIINFVFHIIIFLVAIDSLFSKKKYISIGHIWFFYLFFLLLNLFKIFIQTDGLKFFLDSLQLRIYYFLIPLVYIMLKNKKLDLKRISKNLINSTIFICPLSIYMFLTSNYFGMVDEQLILMYKVVGTPFSRMFSVFGSPLVAGTFFAIIILLFIYENKTKKLLHKILLFLNIICLILTFSRTAFIVLIAVIILKSFNDNKIKIENKILHFILVLLLAVVIILFSYSRGVYFWNLNDIFYNVRFTKWGSFLSSIGGNILFGSPFSLHISSLNTIETTLSDNSILLFLGYYGIILTIMLVVFSIHRFVKKNKLLRKGMNPIILCIIMFCFFYDFVQLFPSNYMLVFLYIYVSSILRNENKTISNEVDVL